LSGPVLGAWRALFFVDIAGQDLLAARRQAYALVGPAQIGALEIDLSSAIFGGEQSISTLPARLKGEFSDKERRGRPAPAARASHLGTLTAYRQRSVVSASTTTTPSA
jgi:hypothetical protein